MTKTIDELRGFLRGYLTAHRSVEPVPPKTAASGNVFIFLCIAPTPASPLVSSLIRIRCRTSGFARLTRRKSH